MEVEYTIFNGITCDVIDEGIKEIRAINKEEAENKIYKQLLNIYSTNEIKNPIITVYCRE